MQGKIYSDLFDSPLEFNKSRILAGKIEKLFFKRFRAPKVQEPTEYKLTATSEYFLSSEKSSSSTETTITILPENSSLIPSHETTLKEGTENTYIIKLYLENFEESEFYNIKIKDTIVSGEKTISTQEKEIPKIKSSQRMLVSTYEAAINDTNNAKINTEVSYILRGNLKTVPFSLDLSSIDTKPSIEKQEPVPENNTENATGQGEEIPKENFFRRIINAIIALFS